MPHDARPLVLLGPRGESGEIGRMVDRIGESGVLTASGIASITAGWRSREGELDKLEPELAGRATDLSLFARGRQAIQQDAELAQGFRTLRRRLVLLRRAYNAQLAQLTEAHRNLQEMRGEDSVLGPSRTEALTAIQRLDTWHVDRVAQLRDDFQRALRPQTRLSVRRATQAVRRDLGDASIVFIGGGHVGVLLNRLCLFGGRQLLENRTIIARSAGAMAIASRVVLFHDRPPWGEGHPEILEAGLGLTGGLIPFPGASARLRLEDRRYMARLAARCAPGICTLLDPGQYLVRTRDGWHGSARRIDPTGRCVSFFAGSQAA